MSKHASELFPPLSALAWAMNRRAGLMEPPACSECGCRGRQSCGATPLDAPRHNCELDQTGTCYCCRKVGKDENRARWTSGEWDL